MTANMTPTKSPLTTGCFYVAAYLGFGAACTLTYQWAVWMRSGTWIVYDMSLILGWLGWLRPPSLGPAVVQSLIEGSWQALADCPISLGLGFAAATISALGLLWSVVSTRGVALRNAH